MQENIKSSGVVKPKRLCKVSALDEQLTVSFLKWSRSLIFFFFDSCFDNLLRFSSQRYILNMWALKLYACLYSVV